MARLSTRAPEWRSVSIQGLADGLLMTRLAVKGLPMTRLAVNGLPMTRLAVNGSPPTTRRQWLAANDSPTTRQRLDRGDGGARLEFSLPTRILVLIFSDDRAVDSQAARKRS